MYYGFNMPNTIRLRTDASDRFAAALREQGYTAEVRPAIASPAAAGVYSEIVSTAPERAIGIIAKRERTTCALLSRDVAVRGDTTLPPRNVAVCKRCGGIAKCETGCPGFEL